MFWNQKGRLGPANMLPLHDTPRGPLSSIRLAIRGKLGYVGVSSALPHQTARHSVSIEQTNLLSAWGLLLHLFVLPQSGYDAAHSK